MSESKLVMAQKLQRVQVALMGEDISETSYDVLLLLIFEKCCEQNMTFWFSFMENTCVLNLRDTLRDNYELNIRLHHETMANHEELKKELLINTFLITTRPQKIGEASSAEQDKGQMISNDKPVPTHIRKAIETIEAKGVAVTQDSIRNHLPLGEMSTSARIECNKYLKSMEASQ